MKATPIRAGLRKNSSLLGHVYDGIQALKKSHRGTIEGPVRDIVVDSIDLDSALQESYPNAPRWDYLVGLDDPRHVIAIEPHSARSDQVSVVIEKKKHAMLQLSTHLGAGVSVRAWYWIASGTTQFNALERERLRLVKHGITFVGRALTSKYLRSDGIGR